MARNSLPPSNIVVSVVAAFALFIVAIIARSFWLSLILGVAGVLALVYALLLLREYRKSLPEAEKDAP